MLQTALLEGFSMTDLIMPTNEMVDFERLHSFLLTVLTEIYYQALET